MVQLKGSGGGKKEDEKEGSAHFFGVRSYLHQFYQQPTEEELESAGWYLLPAQQHSGRGALACRICSIVGLVLLVTGAAGIVASYTWPQEPLEASFLRLKVTQDEAGGVWVPQDAIPALFRDPMREWKLLGLALFASGGIVLAISILIPTFTQAHASQPLGDIFTDAPASEGPIRVFPSQTVDEVEEPGSPVEKKVPVMEAISKVQPETESPASANRRLSEDELLIAEGEPTVSAH